MRLTYGGTAGWYVTFIAHAVPERGARIPCQRSAPSRSHAQEPHPPRGPSLCIGVICGPSSPDGGPADNTDRRRPTSQPNTPRSMHLRPANIAYVTAQALPACRTGSRLSVSGFSARRVPQGEAIKRSGMRENRCSWRLTRSSSSSRFVSGRSFALFTPLSAAKPVP